MASIFNLFIKQDNMIKSFVLKEFQVGSIKYAQYDNALCVRFVEKGKRKQREIIEYFQPWMMIVESEQPLNDLSGFDKVSQNGNVIRSQQMMVSNSQFEQFVKDNNAKIIFNSQVDQPSQRF